MDVANRFEHIFDIWYAQHRHSVHSDTLKLRTHKKMFLGLDNWSLFPLLEENLNFEEQ